MFQRLRSREYIKSIEPGIAKLSKYLDKTEESLLDRLYGAKTKQSSTVSQRMFQEIHNVQVGG